MNRSIAAGLVAASLFAVGCQGPSDAGTQPSSQVEDAIPAAQQVVLKMTGMT